MTVTKLGHFKILPPKSTFKSYVTDQNKKKGQEKRNWLQLLRLLPSAWRLQDSKPHSRFVDATECKILFWRDRQTGLNDKRRKKKQTTQGQSVNVMICIFSICFLAFNTAAEHFSPTSLPRELSRGVKEGITLLKIISVPVLVQW